MHNTIRTYLSNECSLINNKSHLYKIHIKPANPKKPVIESDIVIKQKRILLIRRILFYLRSNTF